jgi:competence protein ComEC
LLALAAAVVLLANPRSAAELSFQLSFLALLGIALLGPILYRLFTPPLPRFLGSALSISVGAQAATAPLLLSCFGAAYPAGVLAALPLIPMVTAFLWGGLASLALSLLPGPPLMAAPLGLLHRAIIGCLGLFARIPPARAAWQPWCWAPVAAGFAALLLVKLRAGRAA